MSLLFGSCRLSEFTLVGPLNWSGKVDQKQDKRCYFYLFIHLLSIFYLSLCNPPGATCKLQNIDAQHRKNIDYAIIPTKYRLVQYRPSRTTFTSMAEMASENAPVLEGERKQYWGVIFGFSKAFSVLLEYVSLLDILWVFHTVITSRIKGKFHSDLRDRDQT